MFIQIWDKNCLILADKNPGLIKRIQDLFKQRPDDYVRKSLKSSARVAINSSGVAAYLEDCNKHFKTERKMASEKNRVASDYQQLKATNSKKVHITEL